MLIKETDFGTPASKSEVMVTLEIDGHEITVPEGTSIMRAAMELGQALRHGLDQCFRLLPPLPC
jgi:formate dehydrogenase major subunit